MQERSLPEKEMIAQIMDPEEPLPFKIRRFKTVYNEEVIMEDLVYQIPEEKKQWVLEKLWCFVPIPKLDAVFFDIHEGKCFTLKEFKVIRWNKRNIIVSPFYMSQGGTIIDFVSPDAEQMSCYVSQIRKK